MSGNNGDPTNEENVRKMREAVRDVQDPERGPITWETVKTLREAGLDDLVTSYLLRARQLVRVHPAPDD